MIISSLAVVAAAVAVPVAAGEAPTRRQGRHAVRRSLPRRVGRVLALPVRVPVLAVRLALKASRTLAWVLAGLAWVALALAIVALSLPARNDGPAVRSWVGAHMLRPMLAAARAERAAGRHAAHREEGPGMRALRGLAAA